MNILISHVYNKDNKGDAAILTVLIAELKRVFSNPNLVISTMETISAEGLEYEDVRCVSSLLTEAVDLSKSPLDKMWRIGSSMTSSFVWAVTLRLTGKDLPWLTRKSMRPILNELKLSDVVIPVGGGYIKAKRGIRQTIDLTLLLQPIVLSIILRKQVMLHSQSIGPFSNSFQKYLVRKVLNMCDLIVIRESKTEQILKDIGVNPRLILKSVDAAFLLTGEIVQWEAKNRILEILDKRPGNTYVGVTARLWLENEAQSRYEEELARGLDYISSNHSICFVFIPQVTVNRTNDDDRIVNDRIISRMRNKRSVINITDKLSHHELKSIYSELNFLIGTRFHSVIFSLTEIVPAIAIEYEHKTSGIMNDLLLEEWVIPIESVQWQLIGNLFDNLVVRKSEYQSVLRAKLPGYMTKAHLAADTIKRLASVHEVYKEADGHKYLGE